MPETPAAPEVPAPPAQQDVAAILLERIAALEAKLTQPPAAPKPETPAVPEGTEDPHLWLKLLSEGKVAEAEALMKAKFGGPSREEILTQATEQWRVEQDLNDYTRRVQADNADIAEMEPFISAAVGFEAQQKFAGHQPTPAEYAVFYKDSVKRNVENARKLVLGYRGQGATNASTRTTQVLASPTFTPQPVNSNREAPSGPPALESTTDYFASRAQRAAAARGMQASA